MMNLRVQQSSNIILITFWSQFASYAFNSIFILFLTRPVLQHGLGYNQAHAYAFIGISGATGYLMPIIGGQIADGLLGIRRSIFIGSIMLVIAYLMIMLSGFTLLHSGDKFFIAAFALLPAANSLLIGTATSMVSKIYTDDAIKAKSAMTYYYLSINIGALLAVFIAPELFESRYGALSVFALAFAGKAIAALNFAYRYRLYDNLLWGKDKQKLSVKKYSILVGFFVITYGFTLFAYAHIKIANSMVVIGCISGIGFFLMKTCQLPQPARLKQLVAFVLILESIVFFIIYNQMSTTLILLAQNNSDKQFLGFIISPAQYQMLNPILIIFLGLFLPRFYRALPQFSIPYQFACGTLLSGAALLLMYIAGLMAQQGIINGDFIAGAYILISLGELLVSAIGFSMIGIYCEQNNLAFAMGVWLLGGSLGSIISGQIARFVSIPENITSSIERLFIYQHYYLYLGCVACLLGILMLLIALKMKRIFAKNGLKLN